MIAFQAVGEKENDDDREGNETHTQRSNRKQKYIYHIKINIFPAIYKVYTYI